MNEQAAMLSRLTRVLARTAPGPPLTHRLCLALTEISGLDGGSMSIGYSTPSRTVLCATDATAESIEEWQDLFREGPGLDAHRLHQVIEVGPQEIPQRWPMLARSLESGPGSVHLVSAPMRPDSEVLGVVTLYGTHPPETDLDQIQFLANAIGVAVLGGFERESDAHEVWSTRDLINQATGMVVAQLRIAPADAVAVLRAHAFAQDRSLASVADAVVSRDLDFHPGRASGPTSTEEAADDD